MDYQTVVDLAQKLGQATKLIEEVLEKIETIPPPQPPRRRRRNRKKKQGVTLPPTPPLPDYDISLWLRVRGGILERRCENCSVFNPEGESCSSCGAPGAY